MAEKMIFCKACGKEIAKSAKVCPHCGKKNKRPFWVGLLIVVGVIILISAIVSNKPGSSSSSALTSSGSSNTNQTVETTAAPSAIEVSPLQLYTDYENNEVKADNLYKGKLLKITGEIKNIGKDFLDQPYISIDTGGIITDIRVSFKRSEQNKLADLSKGQTITITGTCDGKSVMDVYIKESILE